MPSLNWSLHCSSWDNAKPPIGILQTSGALYTNPTSHCLAHSSKYHELYP